MHRNLDNQDLLPRRSPWPLNIRSPPLTGSTSTNLSRPTPACSKLLPCTSPPPNTLHVSLSGQDPLLSSLVPSLTVALEGRSICQRVNLHEHASYGSLARALRQMFGDYCAADVEGDVGPARDDVDGDVELGNAVPGHLVAYEDAENDLLLAGDLSWNDFVRVAKRIRILPAKPKGKRPTTQMKQAC